MKVNHSILMLVLAITSCKTVTSTDTRPDGSSTTIVTKTADPVAISYGLEAAKIIDSNLHKPTK